MLFQSFFQLELSEHAVRLTVAVLTCRFELLGAHSDYDGADSELASLLALLQNDVEIAYEALYFLDLCGEMSRYTLMVPHLVNEGPDQFSGLFVGCEESVYIK